MLYEDEDFDVEEYPSSRRAERRKKEWKYATKRKKILERDAEMKKPLHYYNKNFPSTDAFKSVDISERDKRQRDNFREQLSELFED